MPKKSDERRDTTPGRRLGTDRSWIIDLNYTGQERRGDFDRRYGVSRRAAY